MYSLYSRVLWVCKKETLVVISLYNERTVLDLKINVQMMQTLLH